jgi:formylmethanofuran dehydrogenase subunit D
MAEQFILIPGRTSRQGTSLNEGKYTAEYLDEINTLQISAEDMQRLGLAEGDRVRVWNDVGSVTIPCKTAPREELPAGLLFISYGDISCQLMGAETHCSGMPDSKGIDVYLEKASESSDA